jgi:hypothetical protein
VSSVASAQPCTTDAARVVAEIYRHTLERSPDPGAQRWEQELVSGRMTVRDVVRAVAKSQEYMERFGRAESGEGQPYERAVARLYRHVLARQPDAGGQADAARAAQQRGLAHVVDIFVDSPEYTQKFGDNRVPGSGGISYCGSGSAQSSNQDVQPRLRGMDRNNDGVINRSEWQGSNVAFNNQDWNNDGVLSGDEVRPGARRTARRGAEYDFDALDANRNNRIERREWQARLDQFRELDVDNDNFLSRAEVEGTTDAIGTSGSTIAVGADRNWVDTGINVRAGDTIAIQADGRIRLSGNATDTATASGARRNVGAEAPIPSAPAGALVARVGNMTPLFVGGNRTFRASRAGRLYLGVNDDYFDDNTGQYNVTVDVR